MVFAASERDARYPANKMRYHFNTSSIPRQEKLQSAELMLGNLRHNFETHDEQQRPRKQGSVAVPSINNQLAMPGQHVIRVYDVLRRATRVSKPLRRLVDTVVWEGRKNGVIPSLDVSSAVRRWVLEPDKNHGLLVEVASTLQDAKGDTSEVHLWRSSDDEWVKRRPLLVVHTSKGDKPVHRQKRSALKQGKGDDCRRHRLYVEFRRLGWHSWIVAPERYDAYFCHGECDLPLSDHLNATNHAVVQTLVNSRFPSRVPKACCAPVDLSPMHILYEADDGEFVLQSFQDMIVHGCGCR